MPSSRGRQLALIGLGVAVVPFDSAVNIAFPAITRGFDLAIAEIQWVVISYVLTYASLMLVFGRIGDMFGHARVFRVGLVWSAIACLLCATATNFTWFIVCRFLQGIGAALILSCGVALATSLDDESRRARVIGSYTMMMAIAGAAAPWLGGFLVEAWDWPGVFWFRVPIVLIALALLRLPAPALAPRGGAGRETFDLVGAVLLVVALVALLSTLNRVRDLAALPLGVVAIAALAAFVRQEARAAHPIIDLTVFRVPGFALLNLVSVLVNLAAFAVWLLVPYYLTRAAQFGFGTGGFVLATSAIGTMMASSIGGRMIGRVSARHVALAGAGLIGVGQALVGGVWQPDTPIAVLVATLLVQGSGLGLFQIAYTDIVTATIPRRNRGVAGSLVMVTRTLGVICAATMLSVLFQGLAADLGFMAAFQRTFWLAAALAVAAFAILAVGGARRRA